MSKGLSSETAKQKLKRFGPNEWSEPTKQSTLKTFIITLSEPMIILLIICSTLYFFIGNRAEGVFMFIMVGMVAGISFYQQIRSDRAIEKLKQLAAPRAVVYRNGQKERISAREIVPHDLCIIHPGDRIPADGKILSSRELIINESVLTGESFPVLKKQNAPDNQVYAGTLVTAGSGLIQVTNTGKRTRFGTIGKRMKQLHRTDSRLKKSVRKIVQFMGIIALIVSVTSSLILYWRSASFTASLLSGLATSMALIPEEFPVILTVFLALGAWRLARINVLTRDPRVIEMLGHADILCADKTGTITENEIKLESIISWDKEKNLSTIDPTMLSQEKSELLNLITDHESMDPIERALEKSLEHTHFNQTKVEIFIPFDHERRYSLTIVKQDDSFIHLMKGAPEELIQRCDLDPSDRIVLKCKLDEMTRLGIRTLAVVKSSLDSVNKNPKNLRFTFVCFLGFSDPIRKEVPEAMEQCKKAGIHVIMVTGDHSGTAAHIGEKIGLNSSSGTLCGKDIEQFNDRELYEKLKSTQILSRADPIHKLRIIQLLKKHRHIVAMTGDGVNDAPSLKAAHIGIAMGNKGTDVAREAASIVLLDDNFASIVSGIRLGRRIASNLKKAMSYALAVHIPIVGLTLIPIFLGTFSLILLPVHVVFMELIIDPISSIVFEGEASDEERLNNNQPLQSTGIFSKKDVFQSILEGVMILLSVVTIYWIFRQRMEHEALRALCFYHLICGNLFLALSKLSEKEHVIKIIKQINPAAKMILSSALGILILCLTIAPLQNLFLFKSPGNKEILISSVISLIFLGLLELIKYARQKNVR